VGLDHGAHGTVQDQDAVLELLMQEMDAVVLRCHGDGPEKQKPGRGARSGLFNPAL
jgi:hypothetical protein